MAWQLAVELRDKTIVFLDTFPVGSDRQLFDQLRDSVASPPSNIAEGFGRFEARDFARFLTIARASLDETDNHLRDLATRRGQTARCGELVQLTARCRTAVVRLRGYLLSPRNPWLNRRSSRKMPTEPA